uniref:Phytocyanin domain-containing protein n=1 Tax=Brassica campestris TaxID=3711 RepID=M4EA98_BRACM
MANRTRRIFSFVFAMMMSFTVLSGCCSAREYKVGDSEGWTAKDDVYYSWAETDYKEFHVGDSLVFEYDPNINDVIHVSGALEYELCDYSSPKAIYNTGHDVVVLTEPETQSSCHHDPSRPVPPPQPSKILPVGKTYKVGDSKGWKVYDSDFYNKWSEEKQFRVGDGLLFEYANEVNNVYKINGDLEFITCDPTSPVAVYKTGHDLVRLTEPGVHYFITSQSGYCEVVIVKLGLSFE